MSIQFVVVKSCEYKDHQNEQELQEINSDYTTKSHVNIDHPNSMQD